MSCKRGLKPIPRESSWKRPETDHAAAWRRSGGSRRRSGLMQPTPIGRRLAGRHGSARLGGHVEPALAESPQLAGAQAGVARAQAALSRECAGRNPNVELQAGVQYDNATRDTIAGVQVGVPLPIYNRNQGNIRKAQAELAAAQQEVAAGAVGVAAAFGGWSSSNTRPPSNRSKSTTETSCPMPKNR